LPITNPTRTSSPPSIFHSFLTRFRAALAELDRSAWENMMKTCMTPVTSAIPAAVNATPLHVDRSCVHLKNSMAPNSRRHDQNRVTWSINGSRKSVARRRINTCIRMHIRQKKKLIELWNEQQIQLSPTQRPLLCSQHPQNMTTTLPHNCQLSMGHKLIHDHSDVNP
jgi:hypothetical protein